MTLSFRLTVVLPAILVACLSQPLAAADNDLASRVSRNCVKAFR